MHIHGLQKTTLLDYPTRLASTVFTPACNLRCPFCHNARLVTELDPADRLDQKEVLAYLSARRNLLDGICITGGEPTLQNDLADFIRTVRSYGLLVKLDTNGTAPHVLEHLLGDGLLDYVAMDIKNTPEKYPETVGLPDFDVAPVLRSIDILTHSGIEYEFRTTVVDLFHTPEDIGRIARLLAATCGDAPLPRYALQPFVDSGELVGFGEGSDRIMTAPDAATLQAMLRQAQTHLPGAILRGA